MFDLWGAIMDGPSKIKETTSEQSLAANVDLTPLKGIAEAQKANADHNKGRLLAGRQGADFWQGTRQNLPGNANPTNRANLGAKLGTAHSVMDDESLATGAGMQLEDVSRLASSGARAEGLRSNNRMAEASNAFKKETQRAELETLDNMATLDAALGFVNNAVSGWSLYNSWAGANPKMASGISDKVDAAKSRLGDIGTGIRQFPARLRASHIKATQPAGMTYRPLDSFTQYDWRQIRG